MSNRYSIFGFLITAPMWLAACGGGGGGTTGDNIDPPPIGPANSVPTISGVPIASVAVGGTYAFTPSAADPDGDQLAFNVQNKPSWGSFSSVTGELWGTPDPGDEGDYADITIVVSDGLMSASLPPFSLRVMSAGLNNEPSISGVPQATATVGQSYTFAPGASDPDGDTITFSVQDLPVWAAFNTVTGVLTGTPQAGDEGEYSSIAITATDGMAFAALPLFNITVNIVGTNNAPEISGTPPASVIVGVKYEFAPDALDRDGDGLSFSINNRPEWASFDTTTGKLSGIAQDGDEGSYTDITIIASDGEASVPLKPFAIAVLPRIGSNNAPQISGLPPLSAAIRAEYLFEPSTFDPDGDALTFGIVNKPTWASFSAANGSLSGTPQSEDEGAYTSIVISVSDGTVLVAMQPFSIVVYRDNNAPTISGSPGLQVGVGETYSFAPVALDADGDTLTFSIENLPSWASFSDTTGSLQGIPQEGDVGTYDNITISVSDGDLSDSLSGYSLVVNQIATGSISFSWTAPTENEDGSPLLGLAGYKFYYGSAPNNYSTEIVVDNASITSYLFEDLTPGIYYFAAKSVNSAGISSGFTADAMVEIVAD